MNKYNEIWQVKNINSYIITIKKKKEKTNKTLRNIGAYYLLWEKGL